MAIVAKFSGLSNRAYRRALHRTIRHCSVGGRSGRREHPRPAFESKWVPESEYKRSVPPMRVRYGVMGETAKSLESGAGF